MFSRSNPTLSVDTFQSAGSGQVGQVMTLQGVVNKSFILITLVFVSAFYTWSNFMSSVSTNADGSYEIIGNISTGWLMGGAIIGLILALVTTFKKEWSPVTAPMYAICEGLVLGMISAMYEVQFGGIVMQAIGITFAVFFALLFMYKSRMIKATAQFKKVMGVAMMAIFLVYTASFIMSFFGKSIPMIHSSGPIGIGFSLVVCVVAALMLIMDFDFIEAQINRFDAPTYMEWYCGFSLLVTLIWLYLEILRLLAKLNRRND